jgi:hypothetical protein
MPSSESFESEFPASPDWGGMPEVGTVDETSRSPGFVTLRQILFPRTLPDLPSLGEAELSELLQTLELELLQRNYRVDFLDRLPARTAYRGLLQMLDSPLPVPRSPFDFVDIDGCDSACEACFQLAHCPVAKQVLGLSWRKALEQAGANPSWAALYATTDPW